MVDRAERKWLWGFALAAIAITTLPYLIGYSRQGIGWRYTGFLFGVEDGNSYIAKMLRGAGGDWLFRTPYTLYPQPGALVYLPFIMLGKLAAPPGEHEQLVALYHLFRVVSVVLYVFATYDFIALFIREPRWRRLGTALAAFGGGLGWLSVIGLGRLWGGNLPLEFYSPETFGFLMIYGLPHLAFARAFLLWGLRDYLRPRDPAMGWKSGLRIFLIWLGVGIMQPLTAVAGWAVIGLHVVVTGAWQFLVGRTSSVRRTASASRLTGDKPGGQGCPPYQNRAGWAEWKVYFRRALWVGLLSAPLVIYTLLAFQLDPFLRQWQERNRILSPAFFHYLLAYGMLLPLAILGVRPILREARWYGWLVVGWTAAFPLLAYAPFGVQRRLPEAVWVAIVTLFLKWVESGGSSGSENRVRRWAPRWAALSFLSPIVLLAGGLIVVQSPGAPLFVPAPEVKAFEYLAGHAAGDRLVLASFHTSNPLAAWAEVRTVIGHGPESINSSDLEKQVACFYSTTCTDQGRVATLRELGVRYVFWGPEERKLGSWDPRGAPYLQSVYQDGEYSILVFKSK